MARFNSRPQSLNVSVQPQTVLGSQVQVGMLIRNPKSVDKKVMLVAGGSEISRFGLPRLLTNLPNNTGQQCGSPAPSANRNFHQFLYAQALENGSNLSSPGWAHPIDLDREYELIAHYNSISVA